MSDAFSNDQADLLETIADILNQNNFRYFVTGSQASAIYGEPRFTQDIDIVLELSKEQLSQFLKSFDSEEFYLSASAVRSAVARRGMFNLIQPVTGGKVDFIVAKDSEFDRRRMARVRHLSISECVNAKFASPEDVILKKMQWYKKDHSDRHVRDILGVLKVQETSIDFPYIETWLEQLSVTDVWQLIRERQKQKNPNYE